MTFSLVCRVGFFLAVGIGVLGGTKLAAQSPAAERRGPYTLTLPGGTYTPAADDRSRFDNLAAYKPALVGSRLHLYLQFEGVLDRPARQALQAAGVQFLSYYRPATYWVALKPGVERSLLQRYGLRAIFQLPAPYKLAPELTDGAPPVHVQAGPGRFNVMMSYSPRLSAQALRDSLQQLRGRELQIGTLRPSQHAVALEIAEAELRKLAARPWCRYIGPPPPPPAPINREANFRSRANWLKLPYAAGGDSLTGRGVTVGIGDGGDVLAHVDLSPRVTNQHGSRAGGWGDHMDHVSGTVGGAGIKDERAQGLAPGVELVTDFASNIFYNAPAYYAHYDMRLSNNSYGYSGNNHCQKAQYDFASNFLDEQAAALPALLHVFAAGNAGKTNCGGYPNGYHTIGSGYAAAKTTLAIGATSQYGGRISFSSQGPTADGRLKPELCQVGTGVRSTVPTNGYGGKSGTSMAAPGVTGGLALLYELFRRANGGADPQAGLLKAILCNTARDLGNEGPDFAHGFGAMNTRRAAQTIRQGDYLHDSLDHQDTLSFPLNVPGGLSQLKALLYWPDAAAPAGSQRALINDLDFRLRKPGGGYVKPWVLDTTPAAVDQPAVRARDSINNIEQITLEHPPAGSYELVVIGRSVPQGLQTFFLTHDFVAPSLTLTNPNGGEALVAGLGQEMITWRTEGINSGQLELAYSPDNGTSWQLLDTVAAQQEQAYWQDLDSATTTRARFRIRHLGSGTTDRSDTTFTIMAPPRNLKRTTPCEGYVRLAWDPVPGAQHYQVSLKDSALKPLTTTPDTSILLSQFASQPARWVRVRAQHSSGAFGPPSWGTQVSPNGGGGACPWNDDVAVIACTQPPTNGRDSTKRAYSATEPVTIQVVNRGSNTLTSIPLRYRINQQAPVQETYTGSLAPGDTLSYTFGTPADLLATGRYRIQAWSALPADTLAGNDSLYEPVVRHHYPNQPLSLPYSTDFEAIAPLTLTEASIGAGALERCDYANAQGRGRLRSFGGAGFAVSGSRGLTLDQQPAQSGGATNRLTLTFNLSTYNIADALALNLALRSHDEQADPADALYIRGSDTDSWVLLTNWGQQLPPAGQVLKLQGLDLSQALQNAGQQFSQRTQLRLVQHEDATAQQPSGDGGITLDNLRIYSQGRDVALLELLAPARDTINLGQEAITVRLKNRSESAMSQVPLHYQIGGSGPVVSDTIASLAPQETRSFSFSAPYDFSAPGAYDLRVWTDHPADYTYSNDTIGEVTIIHRAYVTRFPYHNGFESEAIAHWFASGDAGVWTSGRPQSGNLDSTANGTGAWTTRLTQNYPDQSIGYLQSPAFDLSNAPADPRLSFMLAGKTEPDFDFLWLAYSTDGETWQRLGSPGSGINWYSHSSPNAWDGNLGSWRVASHRIPLALVADSSAIRFRFVFQSDIFINEGGPGIDDFHLTFRNEPIYAGADTARSQATVNGWNTMANSAGAPIMAVYDSNATLGRTDQALYQHNQPQSYNGRWNMTRSFRMQGQSYPNAAYPVRLYFTHAEFEALRSQQPALEQVNRLAVTQYTGPDEDDRPGNNAPAGWQKHPPQAVDVVPYYDGYYAEFAVDRFSEFYLGEGFEDALPLAVNWLAFTAERQATAVILRWQVAEQNVAEYRVQRKAAGPKHSSFRTIATRSSEGEGRHAYRYQDPAGEAALAEGRYYRIAQVDHNGQVTYSAQRFLQAGSEAPVAFAVYPNPVKDALHISWRGLSSRSPLRLQLIDAQGRRILQQRIDPEQSQGKVTLREAVRSASAGLYTLKLQQGALQQHYQVMIR